MDTVPPGFRIDTLIMALVGVAAVVLYAVLGDLTPTLVHALLWLSDEIFGGSVLLISATIWIMRWRGS